MKVTIELEPPNSSGLCDVSVFIVDGNGKAYPLETGIAILSYANQAIAAIIKRQIEKDFQLAHEGTQ